MDIPDEADERAGASAGGLHNQSVIKAVGLIGCFIDDSEGKTLTDLARRTGMNVSTAYRMLQTLTLAGVLRRNEGDERYTVGPMLLALAGSIFSGSGLSSVQTLIGGLADDTGESVSIGIRDANCVAMLLTATAPARLRYEHRPGERLGIHCTAMGKALLAFSEGDVRAEVAALGWLKPMTSRSLTRVDDLLADLTETRRRGFAVSVEEFEAGVASVAVPIIRGNDSPRAAIGIQGPLTRFPAERLETLAIKLRTAAEIVARLPAMDQIAGA